MTSHNALEITDIQVLLQSYLDLFQRYSNEINGQGDQPKLDDLRQQLQRMEPRVTSYLLQIIIAVQDNLIYGFWMG